MQLFRHMTCKILYRTISCPPIKYDRSHINWDNSRKYISRVKFRLKYPYICVPAIKKRPVNSYLIFAKHNYHKIYKEYEKRSKKFRKYTIQQYISYKWNKLDWDQRQQYHAMRVKNYYRYNYIHRCYHNEWEKFEKCDKYLYYIYVCCPMHRYYHHRYRKILCKETDLLRYTTWI